MAKEAMSTIDWAVLNATMAHAGQLDKGGKPYIFHSLRVMLAVQGHGEEAVVAGVLHDVVEDCGITLETVENRFGKDVRGIVDAVSRRKEESYYDFIRRAKVHPVGRLVKIADLKDNLAPDRMCPATQHLRERYARSLEILES